MKSLSDHYTSSQSNTHETFADLIFCAFVVLLLFVLTLSIEVSQRVRSKVIAEVKPVETVENIEYMTPEQVSKLSERLQKQQAEMAAQRARMIEQQAAIEDLQSRIRSQSASVQNKLAAMSGEQRFTGATEPASVLVAYEYDQDKFIFVRRKEFNHATTRVTGESDVGYALRSLQESVAIALKSRQQRYYSADEANRIYSAFSQYWQINPTDEQYTVATEKLGVTYAVRLSAFIAGDEDVSDVAQAEIEEAIANNLNDPGIESDAMYPSTTIEVLPNLQRVSINGVVLTSKDFKDVLLAFGGRGVMLDFIGYDGPAPEWLVEEVLTPTGYVGKTPKVPSD